MKNKPYRVTGDQQNGHRIAVQEGHGVKKGDRYDFRYYEESGNVYLPVGSLVFIPAVARCKTCGEQLIAPYDGQPYQCTECSHREDERRSRR